MEDNKFEVMLTTILKTPAVKVNRDEFLRKELIMHVSGETVEKALKTSTIEAEISMEILNKISKNLINKRTTQTAGTSFLAGLPGGVAMAATIPVDTLQFFGFALRLAQELAYIYGYKDLWEDREVDNEKVKNQLILFLGTMFGIGGASTALRLISNTLSKEIIKKLPQKALTKGILYPIIKKILKALGIKITKDKYAELLGKSIPIIGGAISAGMAYASMKPMGNNLKDALIEGVDDEYTVEDMKKDINDLNKETGEYIDINFEELEDFGNTNSDINFDNIDSEQADKIFNDTSCNDEEFKAKNSSESNNFNLTDEIIKVKKLFDDEIITEEEFKQIKADLIHKNAQMN